MPLGEFIINVYCEICEAYAAVGSTPLRQQALRSSGRWLSRAGVLLPAGAFQPGVSGAGRRLATSP